ncbi:coiled-coil domain-containing protein 191 [Anthonomus grandis grandis]|uniref:coiled-coil domain-containing protein 191 n=1 Tax=Anthonomus grandis grandis TaxID=2921223 RepID=UPI00216506F9|nr:coiled-coil domain-containing protein 191 [Anthonomus grandis grandis]
MMRYPDEPFSQCENVILEAKRVILIEQLDRIANVTLSDNNLIHPNEFANKSFNDFFENIPTYRSEIETEENYSSKEALPESQNETTEESIVDEHILSKYFQKWRGYVKTKRPEEKLNMLIENLKNHGEKDRPKTEPKRQKALAKIQGCFKNRYKSQKSIIELQRSKIDEQTKIINELKLGIIREDLLKSIENTKIEIREIFSNCSERLLNKAPLVKALDEREKMMVSCQKAPKMIQKMQQRAIERAKYRELILERKRLLEETRQKLLEEALEKKKSLEEEERKRNLETINEQRKKDLQLQKIRNEKKIEFERKLFVAGNFYNKVLKRQCFKKLLNYYLKSKENHSLAKEFYLKKQKTWVMKTWWGHIESKYKLKNDVADAFFKFRIVKESFVQWKEFKLNCVRSMQVAEDFYDFKLTNNTFVHWHRYVCIQIMAETKKMQLAANHHNRKMLFQYFYQWRSLPAVLQLEKAKEERKRKWREKVWQILPDYRPPEDP